MCNLFHHSNTTNKFKFKSPAVLNGNNSSLPPGDLHEGRLGHVKVNSWWIAPAAGIGVLWPIWWAQVGRRHGGELHVLVARRGLHTFDLKASPTSIAIVEQCWAQRRCISSIPVCKQVSVPTSSTWRKKNVDFLFILVLLRFKNTLWVHLQISNTNSSSN